MFAKLFNLEDRGQILVVRQRDNEDNPEIRTYCEPKGLGVCSVALAWEDDEGGWERQQHCFDRFTEDMARRMTNDVFQAASEMSN